jgi:hypothetical protein
MSELFKLFAVVCEDCFISYIGAKGPVSVPPAALVGERELHSLVKFRCDRFIESLF